MSPCLSGPPGTGTQTHALPAWAWAQLRLPPAFEGHFAQTARRALAHSGPRAACLGLRTTAALAGVRGSLCLNGPPGVGAQADALPAWACARRQLWPAFKDCVATLPERPTGRWHSDPRAACLGSRTAAALAGVRGPPCSNFFKGRGMELSGLIAASCGDGVAPVLSRAAALLCSQGTLCAGSFHPRPEGPCRLLSCCLVQAALVAFGAPVLCKVPSTPPCLLGRRCRCRGAGPVHRAGFCQSSRPAGRLFCEKCTASPPFCFHLGVPVPKCWPRPSRWFLPALAALGRPILGKVHSIPPWSFLPGGAGAEALTPSIASISANSRCPLGAYFGGNAQHSP